MYYQEINTIGIEVITTGASPIEFNNNAAVTDNIELITSLTLFLEQLSDEQFNVESIKGSGTVGAHVRHVIEHYESVFSSQGVIDYDNRARNKALESSSTAAITALQQLKSDLKDIKSDVNVLVLCSTNSNEAAQPYQSSLYREFVFLHSHTTHHMAIIRILTLTFGLPINTLFGKAPSTQKFEQNVQC